MMQKKKKLYVPFWTFVLLLSLYAGYLISGLFENTDQIQWATLTDDLNKIFTRPFHNYYNARTPVCMFIASLICILAFLYYYTTLRNFMPGKEFGTARWADIKKLNEKFKDEEESKNRILTQNFRMSLDTRKTRINNNLIIIGGAGTGKSMYEVTPNMHQCNSTYIYTDPKGELLRANGKFLKEQGYIVKVLNLIDMAHSDHYNPFKYIRKDADVTRLITNLIANTTPKGQSSKDPFWDKAECMFLQAAFFYVYYEYPPENRNFQGVLDLLRKEKVCEDDEESELHEMMFALPENHPARIQYEKVVTGAADTIRSILITANSRLAAFENEQIMELLSDDDMDIPFLGIGRNGDQQTKTALFCVIPDSDKTYNFVVGMLYTQIFQELYYQADFNFGGRLPIPVCFWMDEFANVALPDDYCSLLSTMRSREIYCSIIIQNLAQIKALFEKTWETITGNCDALVYLGGMEQSTHKYISEMLGKWTIDKRTTGESKGKSGSSSKNYDVLGRELMTSDEVRKMPNEKCIAFIRGQDPIYDFKYKTFETETFKHCNELGPYHHTLTKREDREEDGMELINENSLEYFKKESMSREDVKIYPLDLISFLEYDFKEEENNLSLDEIKEIMQEPEVQGKITELEESESNKELEARLKVIEKLSIVDLILNDILTGDQIRQVVRGIENGLEEKDIKRYLNPCYSVEQMEEIRKMTEKLKKNAV